jgi:eukaryotic-like serine/threonine-protein kinase
MPEPDWSPDSKPAPRLGSYVLVEVLGSGGMSNVFRAVHEESGNVVAVKVLPRTLAKNVMLLQRFIREAKSAEALDHPNIVSIFDRGFDQGRHYLVLEFVEGRDLHDRVRLNGPMAPDEAVRFIREVAEGLRYAAGRGMIHRDVKPANLLMTPDGHAKIIDLGLALQTEDEDERVTRDGTTVGTVDYMAPEQARDSRQTSERSDIYSLGCTFYYLLTGSAPYPGGGLADKLARHYKAPIPEVRDHRPDVSEGLSLLIRKMMEKKPEKRYADYDQLIAALDGLSSPSIQPDEGVVLDALIVDDDDDDEIGLAPTESNISRARSDSASRPPSTRDQYLTAEIVDDDEDDDLPAPSAKSIPAPPSRPRSGSGLRTPRKESSAPQEISLADLAALDADDKAASRRAARRSSTSTPALKTGSSSISSKAAGPALDAILEEDEPVHGDGGPPRRSSRDELSLKTWIAAGVLVGLSIAIVGFGVSMIVSMMKPEKPPEVTERPNEETRPIEEIQPVTPNPKITKATPPPPKVVKPVEPVKSATPEVKVAAEPPPEEKRYSAEWEARLFPVAPAKPAPIADRPKVVVRRVLEAGTEPQKTSLAAALSLAGDDVEIADTGPFFEDDCQVAGKSRLIRGRGGIRPIIKIDATSDQMVRSQSSKIQVGGTKVDHLVLEGLDIAVDLRDIPDDQLSLILCQGGDLTLRDCSLTVYNANASRPNKYSIIRVEEGTNPNRIVLERSIIRGPIRTLMEVTASKAVIVFDRSIVVGDSGPLVSLEASEKGSRAIYFHRSLIATRGVVLESPGRSNPTVVRSLGSTFAKIEGGNPAPMFAIRAVLAGDPGTALDWSGEDNSFVGWSGWLSSEPRSAIRISGLDGVRGCWNGSDSSSEESPNPWPVSVPSEFVVPADFWTLAPARRGSLIRVATPHARLKELTVDYLVRLPTPELSATLTAPFVAQDLPRGIQVMPAARAAPPPPPPQPNAKGPRPKAAMPKGAMPNPVPQGPLNLTFNVQEAPWLGDLGQFLAEKLVEGTTQATVQVRGGGNHLTSPIRLRDGLSIAILGDSLPVPGSATTMPTFFPKPEAADRALIELHKGDLAIDSLAFSSEGATRPRHWILVEDSVLAIRHCRFRDPGASSSTVGSSIAFVARGTAPIPPRVGPLVSSTDRPTARLKDCLIWTGSDAISAEVGRGVVDLQNCLILSGGPAVTLLPQQVDRNKFEADLVLDRCTFAVDKSTILLGPWHGDPAGPTRPWLVWTRRCVFPKPHQTQGSGALLQVDPDAMARGALFWQSSFDAYDVSRFLASTGPPPSVIPATDLKKQWLDLWGAHHTRGDQGPNARRSSDTVIHFKEKLKTGRIFPGNLEVDQNLQKDMGVNFKNLPSAPKG